MLIFFFSKNETKFSKIEQSYVLTRETVESCDSVTIKKCFIQQKKRGTAISQTEAHAHARKHFYICNID